MTRREAIDKFREQWRWTGAEEGRHKKDYPPVINGISCYLCVYVNDVFILKREGSCNFLCPISWKRGTCTKDSEFNNWQIAFSKGDYKEAQRLAKIIAELPEKEIVDEG